jgi:hypothetical protein
MAKNTDEAVLKLLAKVKQKKDEIAKASKKPQWKTNCSIGFPFVINDSPNGRVNIIVQREPQRIAELYAFLLQQEEFLQKASAELGVAVEMNYMGFPIADWKEDLKARAAQLDIENKKKELEALDKRVNSIVSPEQRREMELAALEAELGE